MTLGRTAAILAIFVLVAIAWAESGTPEGVTSVSLQSSGKSKNTSAGKAKADKGTGRQRTSTVQPSGQSPGIYLDPALVEGSPHGFLPRIGADGRRPSDIYAARSPVQSNRTVGIVIAGLGLQASALRQVLSDIAVPVSLAFTPYGDTLEADTRRVRQRGHETVLLVPTRSQKSAARKDPGPWAILASLDAKERRDRLHGSMARFGGYAAALALSPSKSLKIAAEFEKRGVLFLAPDSGFIERGGRLMVMTADSLAPDKVRRMLSDAAESAETAKSGVIVVLPAVTGAIKELAAWIKANAAKPDGATAVPASRLLKP